MNEKLLEWQQKIDGLQIRERLLIGLCLLVLVIVFLQALFIDPLLAKQTLFKKEKSRLTLQISQQSNEQQLLTAELTAGVNRNKEKRHKQLQRELDDLNQHIEKTVLGLIPPRLMPEVLERVLVQNKGLKLLGVENKPVVSIIQERVDAATSEAGSHAEVSEKAVLDRQGLYRHSFILRLQGNYMDAIGYFESLGKLPWQFYWDDLKYEVDEYPSAIITLEVHTISMSEELLGV